MKQLKNKLYNLTLEELKEGEWANIKEYKAALCKASKQPKEIEKIFIDMGKINEELYHLYLIATMGFGSLETIELETASEKTPFYSKTNILAQEQEDSIPRFSELITRIHSSLKAFKVGSVDEIQKNLITNGKSLIQKGLLFNEKLKRERLSIY